MENLIKMDDLGVPKFLETPICLFVFVLDLFCQNVGIDICWGSCGGRIYDAVMSNQEGHDHVQQTSQDVGIDERDLQLIGQSDFQGPPRTWDPLMVSFPY